MTKWLLISGLSAISLSGFEEFHPPPVENNPPTVIITLPAKDSRFQWNSVVPYAIHVSDKEDGDSDYSEIPTNEVLLVVSFVPDFSDAQHHQPSNPGSMPEPFLWMSTSTCLNCHATRAKLIGPSFEEIAARYPEGSSSAEGLAQKIVAGSTGTWGELKMPPHPDLSPEKAKKIVQWLLEIGKDPNQTYFTGLEGSFRTRELPATPTKGVYRLMAYYRDHGSTPGMEGKKEGRHTVVLKPLP